MSPRRRLHSRSLQGPPTNPLLTPSCDAQGFKDREPGKSEALLIEHVENYFMSGVVDPGQRVRPTNLPPIYFQHAGTCHSPVPSPCFCSRPTSPLTTARRPYQVTR